MGSRQPVQQVLTYFQAIPIDRNVPNFIERHPAKAFRPGTQLQRKLHLAALETVQHFQMAALASVLLFLQLVALAGARLRPDLPGQGSVEIGQAIAQRLVQIMVARQHLQPRRVGPQQRQQLHRIADLHPIIRTIRFPGDLAHANLPDELVFQSPCIAEQQLHFHQRGSLGFLTGIQPVLIGSFCRFLGLLPDVVLSLFQHLHPVHPGKLPDAGTELLSVPFHQHHIPPSIAALRAQLHRQILPVIDQHPPMLPDGIQQLEHQLLVKNIMAGVVTQQKR